MTNEQKTDMGKMLDWLEDFHFESNSSVGSLRIEEANVRQHYLDLPGEVAFWASRAANEANQSMRANYAYKRGRANASEQYRAQAAAVGEKMTESRLSVLVDADGTEASLYDEYLQVEAQHAKSKALLEGMRSKRDMLISLGAHIRQEMQTMPMS